MKPNFLKLFITKMNLKNFIKKKFLRSKILEINLRLEYKLINGTTLIIIYVYGFTLILSLYVIWEVSRNDSPQFCLKTTGRNVETINDEF